MIPVTKFFVQFLSVSNQIRYIGHGATMPFDQDAARLFDTKVEARAACRTIAPHHRNTNYGFITRQRKVIIYQPVVAQMLGVA